MKVFILTFICLFQMGFTATGLAAISPSQVLVLYNADWSADALLTDSGQDSQEIAQHYVRMHTDPVSGEKPYILGLHCEHGIKIIDEARHLNEEHLAETSHDNSSGVMLKRHRFLLNDDPSNDHLRDSRMVEFVLPGGRTKWRIDTLQMEIVPEKGDELLIVENGLIKVTGQIAGNNTDDWTIRLNGKSFAAGALTLKASCTDTQGTVHSWQADYVDIDDVELSCAGQDGKRDDQNFIDDVAKPVKAFLEDPQHALADGTLLKDHIMFMVLCYGLPRTAVAPCGIARGITDKINNFGAIIDFGQRLQLLYYDLEKVAGRNIKNYKFAGNGAFSNYYLRSPQALPLYGMANPFVHPQLYAKKPSFANGPQPLSYTAINRSQHPERFLYFVSRIDAPDPLLAKALIDRAVYASVYAGSEMGILPGKIYAKDKKQVGYLERSRVGNSLWKRGYRHLYYAGQGKNLLEWGRVNAEAGFLNDEVSYLPGGIAATVISHNGWKRGEMLQDLKNGVTATVGAARVYHGAPHIHNKSWWDDDIFYSALMQGKTLGEAWLMNQIHMGWITTFVGDPLMSWAGDNARPHTTLRIDSDNDISFLVVKNEKSQKEVWLRVDLHASASHPQVAQLMAVAKNGKKVISSTFDASPAICLGEKGAIPVDWTLTLMSPFGQKVSVAIEVKI